MQANAILSYAIKCNTQRKAHGELRIRMNTSMTMKVQEQNTKLTN